MLVDSGPKVADYFVSVGLNEFKKPDNDGETLEPITDLAVIFKSLGEEPPEGYECIEFTPSGLPADLNHGSIRSPTCFLCYKRGRGKPPLTDIGVLYEGKQRLMHGCEVVHKTPTKQVANVNNASGMRIFITYRRASPQFAHSSLAVIEICVVFANKGEKPPHAFCLIDKGLNQGLVGSDVYLCYRKSLTRTNSLSYSADIISRYPSEDYENYPLPDCVPLFCLPLGAVVECWPEQAQPPFPIFSTFALTGATGEKIYGAGVTFFEEMPPYQYTEEIQDLLQQQQQNHNDKKMIVQTNKCICLLSRYPFFDAFRRYLMSLYRLTVSGIQSIPIERYITHFLHHVPFPTPQKPRVFVQITHEGFEVVEPSHGPLPVSGASFTALLRCLGTENALVLLYCILTEQKILIHSLRPALLTSVGEALISSIFPFQWKCPYIPMCPLKLADVLSAPFPFIYGIDSRYFDRQSPPTDVTCVDLDTNMITQAVDPKESKQITWKSLPKRPGKLLKDKLDELFLMLYEVANEDNNSAVEMAPLDVDMSSAKKKNFVEISIQEAFLRFQAQVLQGYKQFLLPITSRPNIGSRDITTLFDLQGFVKSRPRGTEKFYNALTKTQLFCHFIETRSLSSSNDAVLAFFDECTEKCEVTEHLLPKESFTSNFTTVVVTPPDLNGLPPGEIYKYNGFPKLRADLFAAESPALGKLKVVSSSTPPRSPVVSRTPHERQQGSVSAKKQANSPLPWARLLHGHCYTIWFIHLSSYIKHSKNKGDILYNAFEVLQKIHKNKAKLSDEVCFRVLMQLSGQFGHPALAVKVLSHMKNIKLQPNAVTWGYYHKAVLEGEWLPETEKRTAKQLWNKLRIVYMASNAFSKGVCKSETLSTSDDANLISLATAVGPNESFHDNQSNVGILLPLETASTSGSDAGYHSGLMSTEDLRPNQPIAQALTAKTSLNFDDASVSKSISNQDLRKQTHAHRRHFSLSSQNDLENVFFNNQQSITKKHTRRLSETSIGSNISDNTMATTNSHIIVCHDNSWQEILSNGKYNSADSLNTNKLIPGLESGMKSEICMEAVICSCQICSTCDKVIYDEEVMGSWSADDSNLNILCPFCQAKKVPTFHVKIKDYRGLVSKVCSTTSLTSDCLSGQSSQLNNQVKNKSVCKSMSNPMHESHSKQTKPIDMKEKSSLKQSLTSKSSFNALQQLENFFSSTASTSESAKNQIKSKPLAIEKARINSDSVVSTSAPSSSSSSPVLGSSGRPVVFQHRKNSSVCSGSFNMFLGRPEEKIIESVPYLSPLVLRKELENLLANDGDSILQTPDIVKEKPILYWNLIWYFRRLGLHSHLPSLLLQAYPLNTENTNGLGNGGEVVISTSWDTNRQSDDYVPMYMLWNLTNEHQEIIEKKKWTPRSLLTTIQTHVQSNDVIQPMKMLLDERSRQQTNNPDTHWSLYRELLFLALATCGEESIDVDAFDREYKAAFREIHREYSDRLQPDDKTPTIKGVFCRRIFDPPTLQPRKPSIT